MTSRRGRASTRPLPCVILGVDPAKISGWAIMCDGELMDLGALDRSKQNVDTIVRQALGYARFRKQPLVMIGENTTIPGRRRSGIDGAWSDWRFALERHYSEFVRFPKNPIFLRVMTNTWRKRTLGMGNMKKHIAKWMAVETVNRKFDLELSHGEHDAAEACCIAWYGAHAREVQDLLPLRALQGWAPGP